MAKNFTPSSPLEDTQVDPSNISNELFKHQYDKRECPSCYVISISGMAGGADSTCKNCGYKDPCCYD